MSRSRYYAIVVVDIESFGKRTDTIQKWLRTHLYRIMEDAFTDAGAPTSGLPKPHDRGDGAFWLLPGDVPKQDLTGPFIERINAGLEEYASVSAEAAHMRLRVSLHAGEVAQDEQGWVGADLNTACRLVDAQPLRDALTAASRAHLALIVSDQWYRAVVRHGVGGLSSGSYAPVRIGIKELNDTAWIRVPGYDSPPGLPDAAEPGTPPENPAPGSAAPEGAAAAGTGHAADTSRPAAGGRRVVQDQRRYFDNATINAREINTGDRYSGGGRSRGPESGR